MPPSRRLRGRGKISPAMVARAAVLFRRGEPREKVVNYFLKRYGSQLGIITPKEMETLLFTKTRGSRPNFSMLFENKSPQNVEKEYAEWRVKRAARASAIQRSVRKRLSNPTLRREQSERSREVLEKLQRNPIFSSNQRASARKTMKEWRNSPEGKRMHSRVMRERRADPFWRKRVSESVSRGMYDRWLKTRIQTMRKVMDSGALRIEGFRGNKKGKRRTRFLLAGPPTPERPLARVQRVQRVIKRLSPLEHDVITQVFFEHRSISKVAKRNNQTPEDVFKMISPAYKKIMRALNNRS